MSQQNSAMKTEGDGPAQSAPTPTPTPTYTTQWATTQIPIDPALQQHAAPSYYQYQHYPQASYGHYQPYIPQPQPAQPQIVAPIQRQPLQPSQSQTPAATNQLDTADVATLNDALGSAGVDLRAEEETLQRSSDLHQSYRPYEDRSHKQPAKPNFDTRFLGPTMRTIGAKHKITKIPDDAVNYVALALRARLQGLLTAMIAASAHRTDTQFDRPAPFYDDETTPMWRVDVRRDVAKQLAALERAEREEEMRVRRERKELAAAQAAALAAHAPGTPSGEVEDAEGPKKKKKKTDGPGVTAKNMSEDVRKKMSNAVASQAAGLGTGKYAWMNAANATPAPAKPKPAASAAASPATTTAPASGAGGGGGGGGGAGGSGSGGPGSSSWARPYVVTNKSQSSATQAEEESKRAVTLRDAMFVVEKERGHGGGRGAARGWV